MSHNSREWRPEERTTINHVKLSRSYRRTTTESEPNARESSKRWSADLPSDFLHFLTFAIHY